MIVWLKTEAKTHLFYLIIIVIGIVAFRTWSTEHDQRVQAENTVKQSQQQVQALQTQITTIKTQAVQKVQTIVKIVHDAQTPAQIVQAVPQLTDVPLNARVAVDTPAQVSVDAVQFVQMLGQAKEDAVN